MRSLGFVAIVALALAACGEREQPPRADTKAARSAEAPAPDLRIGPNGAAGIVGALPMDVAAVRAAAPHLTVTEIDDQVEGEPFKAITLSAGGQEIFRIYPTAERTHIHTIVTRSPRARGPMSEIVGQTLFGVAPQEEVAFCIPEYVADGAPGFACSTAADGRFWRIYRLPEGYEGPHDTFEAIDPDVLHDATLVEMRWFAPRVANGE